MKDTLNFVGDGDDVDVIYNVERTFGIKLTDAEAEQTRTVGQLYDLIELKHPNAGRLQLCETDQREQDMRAVRQMVCADSDPARHHGTQNHDHAGDHVFCRAREADGIRLGNRPA
ncbi:acyl carrier protein [Bradyrhizobium rifense]|uniref:Acyl carrier protein n=1 Tax=Bradyrhizobium rifense TaxID=515499 RepID=A0A5D3KBR4_9BRAD|nr:acyl carrier protein [Bradyrhizobium rifense]TYL91434.1 acyl carrier protein [Bradyrhizobium rifense]